MGAKFTRAFTKFFFLIFNIFQLFYVFEIRLATILVILMISFSYKAGYLSYLCYATQVLVCNKISISFSCVQISQPLRNVIRTPAL